MAQSNHHVYSVCNEYLYTDKPTWLSVLDCFATPAAGVLGGRTIDIVKLTIENEWSTTFKVAVAITSIVIFPMGIVSIVSLTAKYVLTKATSEQPKVEKLIKNNLAQQEATKKEIKDNAYKFNVAYSNGRYDEAINAYKADPRIGTHSIEFPNETVKIEVLLFRAINRRINEYISFEEIAPMLHLLSDVDAHELIKHSIRIRLEKDVKDNLPYLDAEQIERFIQASFPRSLAKTKDCYLYILEYYLKINPAEDITLNMVKADIASQIIGKIYEINCRFARNELDRTVAQGTSMSLKSKAVLKGDGYLSFYALMISEKAISSLHDVLQHLRSQTSQKLKSQNKMKEILKNKDISHDQKTWKLFEAEHLAYLNELNKSIDPTNTFEINFFKKYSAYNLKLLNFVNTCFKCDGDLDKLAQLQKELEQAKEEYTAIGNSFSEYKIDSWDAGELAIHSLKMKKLLNAMQDGVEFEKLHDKFMQQAKRELEAARNLTT